MSKLRKEIFNKGFFKGDVKYDELISAHTSLKIGGLAEVMVFPEDIASLKGVLLTAKSEGIPIFILGRGTNLLVKDSGIEGIVISLQSLKRFKIVEDSENFACFYVEAGVLLSNLINFAMKKGYSGIEALAGIPGTFGGAIYMNAGSFGREIKDVLTSVSLMKDNGSMETLKKDDIRFSYRNSNIPDGDIILHAEIFLKKDSPENVSIRICEFLKRRRQTQPISQHSAGCVFKNPEGNFAGELIESAGCKGMRVGDAEVSTVHANFFINRGSATCKDFINLMETVKEKVKKSSGITLEPEIKIVGRDTFNY